MDAAMNAPQNKQAGPGARRGEPIAGEARTGPVVAALRRVRSRARGLLVTRRLSLVIAGGVAAAALGATLDYLVPMPAWLRMVLWTGGLAALVWGVRTLVLPAWRFNPPLGEVALRLERSAEGRSAGLEGVLTSGLELAEPAGIRSTPAGTWMSSRVVDQALAGFGKVRALSILAPAQSRLRLGMLGVLLIGITALWVMHPALVTTGALRVLAPWSGAAWPKRTQVVDATGIAVHPLGTALPLRAALTVTDLPPGQSTVAVRYRVLDGGTAGPVRRVLLSPQERRVTVAGAEGEALRSGELFERLIEPTGLAPGQETDDEQVRELEYWFETSDDSTRPARILLVEPPAVASATAEVRPPPYAAGAGASGIVSGTIDLGPGNDERAVLGPVLAGSEVELRIRFNKAVPRPPGATEGPWTEWAERTLGAGALGASVVRGDGAGGGSADSVTLRLVVSDALRIPVAVTDSYGLTSAEESVYTVEVVKDRAPTVAVIEPGEDESVLATAEVGIAGEGRDDAGLSWVALERQWARPPPGSIGAPAEGVSAPAEFARQAVAGDAGAGSVLQARVAASLDLRAQDFALAPGDEVWITALAQDTYSVEGRSHEPARSTVRRLRIISEDQFVEQVRAQLGQVRETAKVLDAEQAGLVRALAKEGAAAIGPAEAGARQAGLTERLESQRQAVQDLIDRAGRNHLPDEALRALLGEAQRLAADAARASGAASGAMASPEESLADGQKAEAQEQQERVRDDLGALIDLLDRGQDSWLSRRDLQRLLEDQRALAEQTRAATDSMIGKSPEDLSDQERAALDAIAQRQQELAQRAQQSIDDLQAKADQMAAEDSVQADAMQQAADRGEREKVPQKMEDAAAEARQNRGQQAQSSQQEAAEALEEMLRDLDDAARNRDEALRRVLASLVDTLRGLVRRQTDELAALGKAGADGPFDGLDSRMIRLNQNTLSAAGEVREKGMGELEAIAELVDRAADAQARAIGALRAIPVDVSAAAEGEQSSLLRLREALAEAERQNAEVEKRENERRRRELKDAYRAILESQVALRDETATYTGKALTRKQAMAVRRLGERQTLIGRNLAELRDATVELADASVFGLAHRRLDQVTGAAGARLGQGLADGSVAGWQDSAVRTLQALLESLDDPPPPTGEEFRENEAAQEEGGGGQGGAQQPEPVIPPIAELLLLRSMQKEAADLTRTLDEAGAAAGEVDAVGQLQRDLAEEGRALIEKLMQRPSPEAVDPEAVDPAESGGDAGPTEGEEESGDAEEDSR